MRPAPSPDPRTVAETRRTFVRHVNQDAPAALMRYEGDAVAASGPSVSVLIPTADAERGGHFNRLMRQLEDQTFQDFEVIVVQGDTRQGRALNTGAAAARGDVLIILDDDTRLGHPEVFERLVAALRSHPDIGMAGVANTVPPDVSWLVRRAMKEIPRRHSDIVSEIVDSDLAEHPCCAIPKRVFCEIGGENEIIPRGLDPYLRREIRQAGYRVVVIPDAYIHHLPPDRMGSLIRQFVRNGRQSALCTVRYPEWVIELTDQHGAPVPSPASMGRRALRAAGRLLRAAAAGRFIWLVTTLAYQAGFIYEYVRLKAARGEKALFWVNDFPPVASGISTFFVHLCRHLPSDRILVVAPRMPGAGAIDAGLPFPVRRLPLPTGESGAAKMAKTVLTVFYAVVESLLRRPVRHHCGQVFSSGMAGLVCKTLFGIPYAVYVYGSETVRLGQTGMRRRLMGAVLRNSDRVIANSRYTAGEFIRFGADPGRVQVLYPGVDTDRFRPAPPDPELIARYGLAGRRVLLTVARLDERKGHDMVIRALAGLAGEMPDLVYLIPGRGREAARLQELVRTLGLEERVRFLGYVPDDDLPALYGLCDVFVMPNRTAAGSALAGDIEGFGIAFVEAGACGKPVIAGRSGGAIEAVVDGETGLLVDPESVEAVTDALRRLLNDPALRHRLGQAGRRRAEAAFDWRLLTRQVTL